MPLSTSNHGFTRSVHHFNTGESNNTVLTRRVLEPENSRHRGRTVTVSVGEMDALKYANDAIDDTWRILNYGSGNQERHLKRTAGESFKRTVLVYEQHPHNSFSAESARTAARFEAGNCDQMAAVNALLLASSPLQQPVSIVSAPDVGHSFVEVGDSRATDNTIISDAWPEFGRAVRRKDFALLGSNPVTVARFNPDPRPEERETLLRGPKERQRDVDRQFARSRPDYPMNGHQLVNRVLRDSNVYVQEHASKNLGVSYEGDVRNDDNRREDQNFSERQFRKRLRASGIDPNTGAARPVAATVPTRRPSTHHSRYAETPPRRRARADSFLDRLRDMRLG
ncbi:MULTISPECIES: Hrp-dependent type III effector protein [unclassified Pseudomonas]|uniref:Hrp-dependent type III effector protein n=1 Tax=unclassified Pseudomonas TaxID=196821 RepID=UPI0025DFF105|nr:MULTISPECIES: Hrp-dependent type III effector protein [unclassified Pseudomonas]